MGKISLALSLVLLMCAVAAWPLPSASADDSYEGSWQCQFIDAGQPFGKIVAKEIKKLDGNKYAVKVGSFDATTYMMDKFLVQDDNPKFGLMIKDGVLYEVEVINGTPTIPPDHVRCTRAGAQK